MRKLLSLMAATLMAVVLAVVYAAPLAKYVLPADDNHYSIEEYRVEAVQSSKITPERKTGQGNMLPDGMVSQIRETPPPPTLGKIQTKSAGESSNQSFYDSYEVYGYVSADKNWTGGSKYGIYRVPMAADDNDFTIQYASSQAAQSIVVDQNSMMWYQTYMRVGMMRIFLMNQIDAETWQPLVGRTSNSNETGDNLTLDPQTGDIYGSTWGSEGILWRKYNFSAGTRETIGTLEQVLLSVAARKDGSFYGLGKDKAFYKIDKTTGKLTKIAQTDIDITVLCGAFIDNNRDKYVVIAPAGDVSGVWELDLTTGEATLIKTFDRLVQVSWMFAKELPHPKAPGRPTLEMNTEGASLKVNLKLTLPTTLNDGSDAADQSFGYSIRYEDKQVAEGTASAGSIVTTEYELPKPGKTYFKANAIIAVR